MNNTLMEKKALDYLQKNSNASLVFVTSDGNLFENEEKAKKHSIRNNLTFISVSKPKTKKDGNK